MGWLLMVNFITGIFSLTIHEAYPTRKIRNTGIRESAREWLQGVFHDSEKENFLNRMVNLERTLVVNDESYRLIDESPFCWVIFRVRPGLLNLTRDTSS